MKISIFNITRSFDGQMPQVIMPNPAFYQSLGEEKFRALVSRHYELLNNSSIHQLFPKNPESLQIASNRSADFFIQIMGGPNYYKQNRGEPMMRKRHMPFKIDMEARLVWLECYQVALKELTDVSEPLKQSYWNYLDQFSLWMVNS